MKKTISKSNWIFFFTFILQIFLTHPVQVHALGGINDTTFNTIDKVIGSGFGTDQEVNSVAIQNDGKILICGRFKSYNSTITKPFARLNSDGSLDTGFQPDTNAYFNYSLFAVQNDGKIITNGVFKTSATTGFDIFVRLNPDGTRDNSFKSGSGFEDTLYHTTSQNSMALQNNGKILIGGTFTHYDGIRRINMVRLNSDGSLDHSFDPDYSTDRHVSTIAIQSDGKILIGGLFTTFNFTNANKIARLNPDGTLDKSFNPVEIIDGAVYSIIQLNTGKILIGGSISYYDGTRKYGIARLNSDGSLDKGFDPGIGAGGIETINVLSDGKILIGGVARFNGTQISRVARLHSNGLLDQTFSHDSLNNSVNSIAVQKDGKIIIGGSFTKYNGSEIKNGLDLNHVARLNSDGSLDSSFNKSTGVYRAVSAVAIQSDRKILIGGVFTKYNNTKIRGIARINPDGSLDKSFYPGAGVAGSVSSIIPRKDGKILVSGNFYSYDMFQSKNIVLINQDGSPDPSFNISLLTVLIFSVAIQSDDKILVACEYIEYKGNDQLFHYTVLRFNPDGSKDSSFAPSLDTDYKVESMTIQNDSKILIAGSFADKNGTSIAGIARLNTDGKRDNTFKPIFPASYRANSIALQNDGKILVQGTYTDNDNTLKNRFDRLNTDGSPDASFNTGTGPNESVNSIVVQNDSKIVFGGRFTSFNGTNLNRIACLNSNGTLDATFNTGIGANGIVNSIAIQNDGNIIIGGSFTSYNGFGRNGIARISGSPITTSLLPGRSLHGSLAKEWTPVISRIRGAIVLNTLGKEATVCITGISGKIIYKGATDGKSINIPVHGSKLYLIQTKCDMGVKLQKIMILKSMH